MADDEREGAVHRKTGSPPFATLTTPCTLQQLRVWLEGLDVQASGAEKDAQVTTTATTINIA